MKAILNSKNGLLKYWYIPLVIGISLLMTGLYVFSVPEEVTTVVVTLISLFIILSAAGELFFYTRSNLQNKALHIAGAVFIVLSGIYFLFDPGSATTLIALLLAIQLAVRSLQGIIFSFGLKSRGVGNWYLLALLSGAGIVSSVMLVTNPEIIGVSIVLFTGVALIMIGLLLIGLALIMKRFGALFTSATSQMRNQAGQPTDVPYEIVQEKLKN
ncbi:MAG TPA: DUF308 domain-containing protein [Dyadobacter sp.]|nr:DUF308 domain-containing protein [Dyadobacter sp.]